MNQTKAKIVEPYFLPLFVAVTSLFFLWGFPNDLTNPMVEVFKNILNISNTKAAYVQLAFYGGYGTMAIPAALYMHKFGYKSSIILGLLLFMAGCLLTYPAAKLVSFNLVLVSLYILTFGLAFLETTANPMILAMGNRATATQRLNLSQAFNPIGALTGQMVARVFVLERLQTKINAHSPSATPHLTLEQKQGIMEHDMGVVCTPYVILGLVVLAVTLVFFALKIDTEGSIKEDKLSISQSINKLFSNRAYYEGVLAQFFYIACQIMVWTFIYQYVTHLNEARPENSQLNATLYMMLSTLSFLIARWICTFLINYIDGAKLMLAFSFLGALFCVGAILINGVLGLYCLVGVSFSMSLMFPTIYGIALKGMGDEAKLGSAGLILAIVGGALLPPLQGRIIDMGGTGLNDVLVLGFIPEINFSFILPLVCIALVGVYSYRSIDR
ncbi:MAG: L-fucose:H+ symporter permease [Myxococcales bacterium]|nr:L-fucose:H+ symporter permease [Myxococcales bacterium]